MAYRFPSSRIVPSTNRFSKRFAFIFTISLSFTYLCYSIIFCCSAIMTNQSYDEKGCLSNKNIGSKKLLQKSNDCTLPAHTRFARKESRALQGSSYLKQHPVSSSSTYSRSIAPSEFQLTNLTVSQRYGNKKLPNALIVGVKKGGTRAVLEFIRIHPDVRALGTEPHFFDRNYDRGLDWYR